MFCRPGELNDFRNVGEVVQRESDRLRFKVAQFLKIVIVLEDLQVEEPDIMTSRSNGLGHSFQTQRFKPKVDLGVHQGTWMDQQHFHLLPPANSAAASVCHGKTTIAGSTSKSQSLTCLACKVDQRMEVAHKFGIRLVPTTDVLNREGLIVGGRVWPDGCRWRGVCTVPGSVAVTIKGGPEA